MRPAGNKISYGTQQFICGAVATMPLVYMVVAAVMKSVGALPEQGIGELDPDASTTVSMVLLATGVLSTAASVAVKMLLTRSRAGTDQEDAGFRFRSALVAIAVSESGAVMGLVLMLLTGNLLYGGLLCGLSFAVSLFHIPGRYWLEHGNKLM